MSFTAILSDFRDFGSAVKLKFCRITPPPGPSLMTGKGVPSPVFGRGTDWSVRDSQGEGRDASKIFYRVFPADILKPDVTHFCVFTRRSAPSALKGISPEGGDVSRGARPIASPFGGRLGGVLSLSKGRGKAANDSGKIGVLRNISQEYSILPFNL